MTRALAIFTTLLCFGTGCDAFFRGMEEERVRIEAAKQAPSPETPAASDLSARPTRKEVMDWLAEHDIAAVRDDHLHAMWGAVTHVDPVDLARAWSTLDRA